MRIKYVIMKISEGLFFNEVPFIFPETADHNSITHHKEVVSAGFVEIDWQNQYLMCYGKSMTLDSSPRPEDVELLKEFLFS